MNISNIITTLQQKLETTTDSLELLTYSKVIDVLNVGSVSVVATFDDLPANLEDDGNVFLVESEEALFYNVGNTFYSLAQLTESLAYAWGYNSIGQLGDNTAVNKSSPVTVVGEITSWSSVSAGDYYNTGVIDTGIAYAWGGNDFGQLGDDTTVTKSSPVTVVGGITNWTSVAAGYYHGLGLTDTGIAYAWGRNTYGALGDDTTVNKSSPVTVVGGITNWASVSGGEYHSLGLTDTGVAYAWGHNTYGQLGDNTAVSKSSPVTVVGDITNWSSVVAGSFYSLGVTNSGIAYAWGRNFVGNLGDNTAVNKSSPVTVVGDITNWSLVSAGAYHSLGVTDTGIVYVWGYNNRGQLGDDTTVNKSSPVTVVGGITNWSSVAAGDYHSIGLTGTGIAYVWGYNNRGQLGDDTTTSKSSPVTVVGGITNWSSVAAGSEYTIALKSQVISYTKT